MGILGLATSCTGSTDKIYKVLKETVVGSVVHACTGGASGGLGGGIISLFNSGMPVADVATASLAGGAVVGGLFGAGRGLFDKHFEPHKFQTAKEALLEFAIAMTLANVSSLSGKLIVNNEANASELLTSTLATTSLAAVSTLLSFAVAKLKTYCQEQCGELCHCLNCLERGESTSSADANESVMQMAKRYGGK